jgi:hypothetical protein
MICQEQTIPSSRVSLGRSLKPRLSNVILHKLRLTSLRKIKSGTIWARLLRKQRHSLRKIWRSHDTTRKDTSLTLFPSQSLQHHDNHMPHHIHLYTAKAVSTRQRQARDLHSLRILQRTSRTSTSLALAMMRTVLTPKLTALSRAFSNIQLLLHIALELIPGGNCLLSPLQRSLPIHQQAPTLPRPLTQDIPPH